MIIRNRDTSVPCPDHSPFSRRLKLALLRAVRGFSLALLCGMLPQYASALVYTNASQGFETNAPDYWPRFASYQYRTNATTGWIVSDIWQDSAAKFVGQFGAIFDYRNGSNSLVQSPLLSNGIGTVVFYSKLSGTGFTNLLNIESSYNGIDWFTNSVSTNATSTAWSTNSIILNSSSNQYIRFRQVTTNASSGKVLLLDEIAISTPPASVSLTNLVNAPAQPLDMDPVTIGVSAGVQGFAGVLTLTNYWRDWPATAWTAIAMASNSAGVFTNTSAIPGRPIGSVVEYWAGAAYDWDTGPLYTNSVTNFYVVRPRANSSSLSVTGAVSADLLLAGNYQWQRAVTVSNLVNAYVRFAGVSNAVTTVWGDTNPVIATIPLYGTAETNAPDILLGGTNTGSFLFSFNESNLSYKVQPCAYANMDAWPDTPFGSVTTNSSWVLSDGQVTNDPARPFAGRAATLNGSAATNAFLQSPYLGNGVGAISFWYRNWDNSGKTGGTLRVQVSTALTASAWTTVATLTNIITTNYLCATIPRYDTASRYVRLLNDTNANHAIISLDEVTVADPSAGVVLSGLTNSPAVPTWTDAVQVAVTATPAGGAFGLQGTLYYRGAAGWTNAPAMTNSGNVFYGTIPAGVGPTNLAGTVLYYVSCAFQGLDSELTSPTASGTNSYVIPRSFVTITNLCTIPDRPLVGSNSVISAQVLPFYAVSNLTVTAYYRVGAGGATQGVAMTATGASNTYTASNIVFQADPGVPVYYWINASFYGGDPVSPTNSATNVVYLKPRALTSGFSGMVLSGSLTNALLQTVNGTWQGVVTLTSSVDPAFRFAGISGVSTTYWGVAAQSMSNYPYYGTAQSNGGPVTLYGTNTGYFVFDFNETSGVYAVRRCAYVNFDTWSNAAPFGPAYTNSDGWILNDGRTTTNSAADAARVFGGSGQSGLLNQDPGTNQYIMSPYLADGIGQVSFWYRNWETNVSRTNAFYVQVAVTNTAQAAWTTIATFTNVVSQDYLYFATNCADLVNHGVRILNATNSPHAILCLDEIVFADAGANVLYSGLTNDPANPTILTPVNIQVDVNPRSGAIVTNMICWFRLGTSGIFETIPMAPTGSATHYQTTASITNTEFAQYAVQCFFSGYQSELTSPLFFPPGGTNNPQSYTCAQPSGSYRTQGFETNAPDYWPRFASYQYRTNATTGWIVSDIWQDSSAKYGTSKFGALFDYRNGSNSLVQSPLLSNGIGTLTFYSKLSGTGFTNLLNVENSYNGIDWFVIAVSTNVTSSSWTTYNFLIDSYSNQYIRLRQVTTNASSGKVLLLDEIAINYPAARVAISNVFLNPGYPTTSDVVNVSCDISSVSPLFPAYAIQPAVWYRAAGGTWTILPMTRSTGNTFTNAIPPFNPIRDGKVEYCIRCDFTGYRSDSASDGTSPAFYPSSGTNAPLYYITRAAPSSYSNVAATVNGQATPARMLAPGTWQVVVSPSSATNAMTIAWSGYGYSTGAGWSAQTVDWGLSNGWQTALPLADYAYQGQSSITVTGSFSSSSSYLIRFNEVTGEYLVLPCVSQSFDNSAEDTAGAYKQKALSNYSTGRALDFDDWSTNTPNVRFEDFSNSNGNWIVMTDWEPGAAYGPASYVTFGCKYDTNTFVMQTSPTVSAPDDCFVAQGSDWDPVSSRLKGIGSVTCKVRSMSTNDKINVAVYLMATTNATTELDFIKSYQWIGPVYRWTNAPSTNFVSMPPLALNTNRTFHVIYSLTQNLQVAELRIDDWYSTNNVIFSPNERDEKFDGMWTNMTAYTNGAKLGLQAYVTFGCKYTNANGRTSVLTKPSTTSPIDSFVAQGSDWDPAGDRLQGIGTIDCSARSLTSTNTIAVSLYFVETTNVVSTNAMAFADTNKWIGPVYTWTYDPSTNFVSMPTFQTNLTKTFHVILSATQNVMLTDLMIKDFNDTSRWTANQSWIRSGGSTDGGLYTNECVFDTTRWPTNTDYWLESPAIFGGVATVEFYVKGIADSVGAVSLLMSTSTPPTWTDAPLTNMLYRRNGPYIGLPSGFSNLANGLTLSAWALPSPVYNRGARFFDLSGAGLANSVLFGIGDSNALVYSVWTNGTGLSPVTSPPVYGVYTNLPDFHHYVATEATNGVVKLFRDGIVVQTGTTYVPENIARTANYIAKSPWLSDANFTGGLDEMRISAVARSTNWVWAEYNTMASSSFRSNSLVTKDWVTGINTGYQMQVSFKGYTGTENLTNFPVLIEFYGGMPTGSNTFSFTGTPFLSSNDLRFGESSDPNTTNLNFEIETWNTSARCQIWVQVPVLSNNASIWARWGNPAHNQQRPCTTNGSTWSNGYVAVWHMGQTNIQDSTTNAYHGTANGNTTTGGRIGNAQWFDPSAVNLYDRRSYVLISSLSPIYFQIKLVSPNYSNQMSYSTDYYVQTNLSGVAIDKIVIGGLASPLDWFYNNGAYQSAGKYQTQWQPPELRQYYKGALFLNSNSVSDVYAGTGLEAVYTPYSNLPSFIRTPSVPGGIGEVSFWYRNWETNAAARPANLIVQRSSTGGTNVMEWIPLAIVNSITNTRDYAYFSTSVYDTSNSFVRILNNSSDSPTGTARVCIDDIVVTTPLGSTFSLSNLTFSPVMPLATDRVDVAVDVYHQFYGPSNFLLTTIYGTTSNYAGMASLAPNQQLSMICVDSNLTVPGKWYRYRTSTPIPTNAADTFVKYYVTASYDGYFPNPITNRESAIIPTWYSPLAYSATNPYYIVFSCPTGSVWINEVNPVGHLGNANQQYVEFCGRANSDISRWQLLFHRSDLAVTNTYQISDPTLIANATNGFGFWLLAGTNYTATRDMALTHSIVYPGGVDLRRGCGASVQAVCWGSTASTVTQLTSLGFLYLGSDINSQNKSWSATGTGSWASAFASNWVYSTTQTPRAANVSQVLVGVSQNAPPPSVTNIVAFWLNTNVWIECTGTNSWVPTPWYSTNLLNTNGWTSVTPFWSTYPTLSASNTFTVHFDIPTNAPSYFYRIVHTNGQ